MATDASPLAGGRNRRVRLIVGLAAVVAVGAVVGATLWQTHGEHTTVPGAVVHPRSGPPLLELEFGIRSTAETRDLAQAEALLDNKTHPQPARAATIFRRYHSLEAQLGLAFATWGGPSSLGAVRKLVAAHRDDPAALLNLGLADFQAGRNADAAAAWNKTARRFADSPYGVDAEDALHGGPPGLPAIVTGLDLPKAIRNLPAAAQLAALKRAAARPSARAKLLYGTTLWNVLSMPVSAERELAAAAKLAPHDPVVRVAAAVALFSKADPTRAFARLGPLTAVFPHSGMVEFHLGELLVYHGDFPNAAKQLRMALADGPHSPYAKDARTLLASLASTGSK